MQKQSLFWPWSSQSKFISLNCGFINAKSQEKKKSGPNPVIPLLCYLEKFACLYFKLPGTKSVFPAVSDCVQDNRNNVGI